MWREQRILPLSLQSSLPRSHARPCWTGAGRATCRKTPEGGGISQGFRHERARPLRAFQDRGRHSRANGDETASPSPRSRVHAAGPRWAWNLGLPSLLGDLPGGVSAAE